MRPMPCKYFAKGGCKFGRKCALLHITPDGHVVNRQPTYPPAQQYLPGPPLSPGGFGPAPPGLLSMQAQGLEQRANGDPEFDGYLYSQRNGYDVPQIDMTYTSASPKYGSPKQHDGFAASPTQKGLSVLDAPLPNSFDSNGVSWAARNGPFAASVPSKFGFDSAPSSLPKSQLGSTALRDLHTSAFGGGRGMDNVLASMGSSPTSGGGEPIIFEKRSLHSERLRASRYPGVSVSLSTSLGTRHQPQNFDHSEEEEDDGGSTDREEDLLPSSLHDLIPAGRTRRDSRNRLVEDSPQAFLAASRRSISGHGTPQDSKVGSPHSSSPSRYTNMFQRNQNAFGHVGSPLRDSSSSLTNAYGSSSAGELNPSVSSPPRQASMSMLTQELQRSKLDAARSGPLTANRTLSNGASARTSLDRNLSSSSVNQRIDEEQEPGLFDMDSVDDAPPRTTPNGNSTTNPWGSIKPYSSSPRESTFGPIGGQRTTK